ncbi:MAG TPA: biotin--[acetyl-CoA-carboxylase] ligase [Sphingobacterium sp.]|nr:biotin--[acetyl-CoA-carboxylase] ligase [Sphingobacterium sp.]
MQNNTFSGESLRQTLIVLDEIGSTNDYLKSQLSNFKPLAEGTAILAEEQFQGKGQRGSSWVSEPGKNLTTSILLKPHFLPIAEQFALSATIAIATVNWLKSKTEQPVAVKWPNDIYVNSKKITGILIENKLKGSKIDHAIIGIGVNINQINFDTATTITSLACLTDRQDYNIKELAQELFQVIQQEYLNLYKEGAQYQLNRYNALLFWRGEERPFLVDGIKKTGIIQQVSNDGKLLVLLEDTLREFDIKEITHLIT